MIKSVVSLLNKVTRKFYISPTAIVEGRDITCLSNKLQANYEAQRRTFLQQQAFKVKISNMSPAEAQLQTLHRSWVKQTSNLTPNEYGQNVERLQDQIEQERRAKARNLGHI